MKTTDLIRSILDIIDQCDGDAEETVQQIDPTIMVAANDADEMARFKQILDLIAPAPEKEYSYANMPNERTSDVASVTVDAGGGVNGPKHPADIRGEHGRLHGGN